MSRPIARYTAAEIRYYCGQSLPECRVRVARDGMIHRYGSPNLTDRSADEWRVIGSRAEVESEMDIIYARARQIAHKRRQIMMWAA
jgi:hypothetical protein